ncbi:uracil-DNA glycosylase [Aliidongia dinghuensis]|uniref:Uracil-DNA glycosylase n=1 Tax=Aliidongia dinghuensis TaxID=1867774 RepID=A0A8J2YW46_9PROT|nr:uracil-DNA glycosylase family protein [Aliidongia dinghuensis]GGF30409.1 uracil-DNA glycosylase [Aliidongia dinghuensis]
MPQEDALAQTLADIRACRECESQLPLGPRPVIRASVTARLLIIAQAPGTRVHETGLSFNDRSGDRLRDWLGVSRDEFYDESRIAIMGMGFCYPGVDRHGGDLPPRPECAPLWHPRVLPLLPAIELTLLIGLHAHQRYLPETKRLSVSERVARWREQPADRFVLPHPSWRNTGWLKRNPWFTDELLPVLRLRVRAVLDGVVLNERG